jgi:hypothetical protein
MGTFFGAMRDEIEAEGGTVEKYIGDAVMAVFGVPAAHEDDPARALRAAFRMHRRLATVNDELRSLHDVELGVRVGVNTGEVLAAVSPREGEGIETLIVFVGSNNALSSVTHFDVRWSDEGYGDLKHKDAFNVWRPSHFAVEFDLVAAEVRKIRARHVIWATVPHVTVIPLAHGVGTEKQRPGSRYFPYYTWPWIDDRDFHPKSDPHLTHQQARAIDSAIDMYDDVIVERVREARRDGLDWYVLDLAGFLDRLAYRRYVLDPSARPAWWTPYQLPPEVEALGVDSRFFESDPTGLRQGGLFALDGVHPTTVGYGLVAQEFINVMHLAGVGFPEVDPANPRSGTPRVDWARVIARDTLISSPPASLIHDLRTVGWLDEVLEVFQRLLRRGSSTG